MRAAARLEILGLGDTATGTIASKVNLNGSSHRTPTAPNFEQTHWPASYGGKRNDSGDVPDVFVPYPGRFGFTDANPSPDPQDYNQHGGIYLHLARNGKDFVNFANGYEFAIVDESNATEPTGSRQRVNVPMEKIVRDNSDHFFPELSCGMLLSYRRAFHIANRDNNP